MAGFRKQMVWAGRGLVFLASIRLMWLSWLYVHAAATVRRHHVEAAALLLVSLSLVLLAVKPAADIERPAPRRPAFPLPLLGASLSVIGLVLYWPSLHVGMLSDDFVLRTWAQTGEIWGGSHEFVRPVPLLLWRIVFAVGAGTMALHGISLALHVYNAAATFVLAKLNGLSAAAAAAAAVLFVVWPTQVEAVTWNAGIFDVLGASLTLSCVLLASRANTKRSLAAPALLMGILATLTKETALILPVYILVLVPRSAQRKGTRLLLLLLTVWCVGYGFWRVAVRENDRARPALTRYVVKEQLTRSVGPLALPVATPTIAQKPAYAFTFVVIALTLGVANMIVAAPRSPLAPTRVRGLLWTVVTTAPAIGYLFIGANMEGTRYLYMSALGWAVFLSASIDDCGLRRMARPVAGILCSILALLAAMESRILQGAWLEAAAARDGIIAIAVSKSQSAGCLTATFKNPPTSIRGAQLFLNGLEEAVVAASPPGHGQPPAGAICYFEWTGSTFDLVGIERGR